MSDGTALLLRRINELEKKLAASHKRESALRAQVLQWRSRNRELSQVRRDLSACRLRLTALVSTANRLSSEVVRAKGLSGKEATTYIESWGSK